MPHKSGEAVVGRVVLQGATVHIPDVLADPEYQAAGYQQTGGYRTNLGVPLLREGVTIGAFVLTRPTVDPFTQKQIDLVTSFADQAVIAIENRACSTSCASAPTISPSRLSNRPRASEVLQRHINFAGRAGARFRPC